MAPQPDGWEARSLDAVGLVRVGSVGVGGSGATGGFAGSGGAKLVDSALKCPWSTYVDPANGCSPAASGSGTCLDYGLPGAE